MPEQEPQESYIESKHIELSDQYYKSRKQLMLFSGLFFIYEFIGLDIPAKPLAATDIIIKSPQAVPLVLLILVVYFLYRLFLGWQLSSKAIREMSVSRWDFYPSILVAFISISLFVYQSIVKIQLADIMFKNDPLVSTWYVALLVLFDTIVLGLVVKFRKGIRKFLEGGNISFNATVATVIILSVMMIYWSLNLPIIFKLFFKIVIIGFVIFLLTGGGYYLIKRIKKSSYR